MLEKKKMTFDNKWIIIGAVVIGIFIIISNATKKKNPITITY